MAQDKDYSTYCTKPPIPQEKKVALDDLMQQCLDYQTHRYVDLKKNNRLGQYDKADCDRYRKTQTFYSKSKEKWFEKFDARYSRTMDIDIQARAESSLECKALEIENKELKLETVRKKCQKALKKYQNRRSITHDDNRNLLHQAYNHYYRLLTKVQKLEGKIKKLEKEIDNQDVTIIFGGKKLFHKQFKKGVDFQQWQKEWANRGDRFGCGGSKSEEYGNKKIQLTFAKEYNPESRKRPRFDCRIMLPACLQEQYGKELVLNNIQFDYGESIIANNVKRHEAYKAAKANYEKHKRAINKIEDETTRQKALSELGKGPQADDFGVCSFSFQMLRKKDAYYLHVSVPKEQQPIKTSDKNGVIGLDINYDNLSYANISKQGDLIDSKVLRFNFGPKNSSSHREQMINQGLKQLVDEASKKKKDIVVEQLDFTYKKSLQTKGFDKDTNRMLHTLAYRKIKENLRRLCMDKGVNYREINPAYTSLLGKLLYTKRYGISTHQAAAYVIARRFLQHEERFCSKNLVFIYKDRVCHLELPDGIFKEQDKIRPFQFWSKLYRWTEGKFKAPSTFYEPPLNSKVAQPA